MYPRPLHISPLIIPYNPPFIYWFVISGPHVEKVAWQTLPSFFLRPSTKDWQWSIYRLTHSESELSGFTCTSSLTMNEKFQYRTRPPSAVLKNFEFIVSERVQVNPDNSRAMSALTFLLFKLNTRQAKIVKFWVSQSHGVMTVVYRIYTTAITPR